jgi:hypothetical protein
MAGVSVIDGFPKVSFQAAFLVAFLVEPAIRATYEVTTAASGAADNGSEGWGFESLRACYGSSCTARASFVWSATVSKFGRKFWVSSWLRFRKLAQIGNSCAT